MELHAFFVVVGVILLICVAPMLLCLVLSACGFTPAGVAARSYASALQSVIGNVAKGSWFAISQSIMATRFLFNIVGLAIVVATVIIALSIYYFCAYEGEYSAVNITSSVVSSFETYGSAISNASSDGTNFIVDSIEQLKTSVNNANITGTIVGTFENVKSSIADANITTYIDNTFVVVKERLSNANITSKISDTFEDFRKTISDANITSEMSDTFDSVKSSVTNANITTLVSDAFESISNSISNANITSHISASFDQLFSSVSGGSVTILNCFSLLTTVTIIFVKMFLSN